MNPWMVLARIYYTVTGTIAYVFQAVGLLGMLLCAGIAIYKACEKLLDEQ